MLLWCNEVLLERCLETALVAALVPLEIYCFGGAWVLLGSCLSAAWELLRNCLGGAWELVWVLLLGCCLEAAW
eukprot:7638836-Lingulodinium_polyedra.AAC.1